MNDTNANALTLTEDELHTLPSRQLSTSALVLDGESLDRMMKLATIMSGGVATMPKHFHKNPADCLAVVMQSMQWGMNPFAVAQKTHLVNGVLGYEGQLVNAVITSVAPVTGRIQYEWYGPWDRIIGKFEIKKGDKGEYRIPGWKLSDEEGIGIRCWATMKGEDQPRVLELLLAQARTRNSTLWADDPKQQLAYLAVKRWSRLHCPDVILGVYTPDELDEGSTQPPRDITPTRPADVGAAAVPTSEFTDEHKKIVEHLEKVAKDGGEDALGVAWAQLTKDQRKAIGVDRLNRIKDVANATVVDVEPVGDQPNE